MPAPITAARLAEATRVSLRSVYRDVDSLRAAGAQIDGERGYGYRLVEDASLPPLTFDRMEIEALTLGLGEVRHMGDAELETAAVSVLAKIGAALPSDRAQHLVHAISRIYRPDGRGGAGAATSAIREACWREQAVWIRYVDRSGAETERTILPLAIVYTDRALTTLAWCRLREAFRMFQISRIADVQATGDSFRPRRVALLRSYLEALTAEASRAS